MSTARTPVDRPLFTLFWVYVGKTPKSLHQRQSNLFRTYARLVAFFFSISFTTCIPTRILAHCVLHFPFGKDADDRLDLSGNDRFLARVTQQLIHVKAFAIDAAGLRQTSDVISVKAVIEFRVIMSHMWDNKNSPVLNSSLSSP